jgi:hypothetical protein
MENNFDLKKFLTENKLTSNSRLLEDFDFDFTAADDDDQYDADFGDNDGDDDSGNGTGDDYTQHLDKFDDQSKIPAWKAIKSSLQAEKGRLISFIDRYATDDRFETLNYGTTKEAGHSMGVSVGMDTGFKYIEVDLLHHSKADKATMNNVFEKAGLTKSRDYDGDNSSRYKIPVNEYQKVTGPLKVVAKMAQTSPPEKAVVDKSNFGNLGDKTGPMGPGPVDKPDGSVYIDGKRITR